MSLPPHLPFEPIPIPAAHRARMYRIAERRFKQKLREMMAEGNACWRMAANDTPQRLAQQAEEAEKAREQAYQDWLKTPGNWIAVVDDYLRQFCYWQALVQQRIQRNLPTDTLPPPIPPYYPWARSYDLGIAERLGTFESWLLQMQAFLPLYANWKITFAHWCGAGSPADFPHPPAPPLQPWPPDAPERQWSR